MYSMDGEFWKMNILYLMHVDWNWIKQRPHFIAEKLHDNGVNVDIYYHKYFYKDKLTVNENGNLSIHRIPRLPLSRFKIIQAINEKLYKNLIHKLIKKNNYGYVYITHPSLFIDKINVPLIYDCMDDVLAFDPESENNKIMFEKECSLVNQSKYVLFTAENLKNTVLKRFELKDSPKYLVNNNAIELPKFDNTTEKYDLGSNGKVKLTYIGTITEWFDFEMLQKLDSSKYEFHLFGPIYNIEQNFPDNFIVHGTVPRDEIFSIMQASDILIMPFRITELIKSVNPVKLYEYIYSCKPIITVKYGESEKFSDFVYFYENGDAESFESCIKQIDKNNMSAKNSKENCKTFVENNTWDKRTSDILKLISN